MNATEYEQYVETLIRGLECLKSAVIDRNRVFRGVRQPGQYEIDVSIEFVFGNVAAFLLIVECKNWRRPVGRSVIQKLAQTRDAVAAHKAAVVSPVGFTKEAIQVAAAHGISLWVITRERWDTTLYSTEGYGDAEFRAWVRWALAFEERRMALIQVVEPTFDKGQPFDSTIVDVPPIGFNEARERYQRGVYYDRFQPGLRMWHGIWATPGIDPHNAVSQIVDSVFTYLRRSDRTMSPPANRWLNETNEIFQKLGLSKENAFVATEAVASSDLATFNRLTGSQLTTMHDQDVVADLIEERIHWL